MLKSYCIYPKKKIIYPLDQKPTLSKPTHIIIKKIKQNYSCI